jgi:hypothetical protein
MKLKIHIVPVFDVDRAKGFYRTEVKAALLNGSLLVQEMKTKRAAGSNGVEEGLDFSWWGRG